MMFISVLVLSIQLKKCIWYKVMMKTNGYLKYSKKYKDIGDKNESLVNS